LAALDLQWSNLNPDKGIYQRLAAAGAVDMIVADAEVEHAITHPPQDTRAYFRGEAIRRYGPRIESANWEAITFDVPDRAHLLRVPTTEPYRGTAEHVGELLVAHTDASGLLDALQARR